MSVSIKLPPRRDLIIAAVAVIGVVFYVVSARQAGSLGFPLDDAWIHQVYGRNLAACHTWAYTPPCVPSAGSTSPLYTVLLAIGYILHIPYFSWAYALGAVALTALGWNGARLAEQIYPSVRSVGLLTGLALVLAWHLVWAAASGMETVIFCALGLLLVYLSWRNVPSVNQFKAGGLFGIVGALLMTTRPEGALLVFLAGGLHIFSYWRQRWRDTGKWGIGAALGFAIVIAPYILLNYSLNHSLFPNTLPAKQAEAIPALAQGFMFNLGAMLYPLLAGSEPLLLIGAIVAVIILARRVRTSHHDLQYFVLPAWAIGHVLLFTLILPAPYQHGRYVIPALPPLIVFSVGGIALLVSMARRDLWQRVLARSLAGTIIGLFVVFWAYGGTIFAQDVKMINSDMVVASMWLADHVPPDQLLAVHDIGAVGYFAPRPMIDLAGLINPEVIPTIRRFASGDMQAYKPLLKERGARYLMVLPNQWFDPDHDPDLCLRFNANGGMGGMRIYEIVWDKGCQ